jgi:solute carrier family 25 aspartate/glutamate transporter 12/13
MSPTAMPKVVAVKEAVKESLIGSSEPVQLSVQTKARFITHAVKDAETGELFMGPDQFIDAIAPRDEDYVSHIIFPYYNY